MVELDFTAGWEVREVVLDLVDKSPVAGVDQCPELRIESEAPVLLADQVHHCERGLVLMLSETATDLLGQDCGGLSWP